MDPTRDTRERILATARSLFHARGYSAVGVAEICKQAGVVKGSFYHFFATKEDLVADVVEGNWQEHAAMLTRLGQAPGTARERLEGYFQGIVGEARRMRRDEGQILGCNIGTLSCELAPLPGELQARLRSVMQRWRRALQALIEQGQADRSIDPEFDARAGAESVLAITQGMSVLGRTFDKPVVLARIADQAMRLLPSPIS